MAASHRHPFLSRRHVLIAAAALAIAPRVARADAAAAEKLLQNLTGGAEARPGKIQLKVPQIAENGATVPFTVIVDSPMSETDYVKAIHVVTEGNPAPGVASYYFTPASGKAEVSSRMRLARTQNVRAVAVMSDGSVHAARQEIKVTVGGCIG